jgi:ribosomal protein L21E
MRTFEPVVRWTAFAGAFAAALFVLAGFRVAPGNGRSEVDIDFVANLTGQLVVQPDGKFLRARGLRNGDRASGRLSLRNITDMPLGVRVRAFSSGRQVDRVLGVSITAGRHRLFQGSLGDLRRWSPGAVRIEAGHAVELRLLVAIPRHARSGFRGRAADVTLEFESTQTVRR